MSLKVFSNPSHIWLPLLLDSKLYHILPRFALQKERIFLISFQITQFYAISAIFIVGSLSIQNENGVIVVQNYILSHFYLSNFRTRLSEWSYGDSEGICPCPIIILSKRILKFDESVQVKKSWIISLQFFKLEVDDSMLTFAFSNEGITRSTKDCLWKRITILIHPKDVPYHASAEAPLLENNAISLRATRSTKQSEYIFIDVRFWVNNRFYWAYCSIFTNVILKWLIHAQQNTCMTIKLYMVLSDIDILYGLYMILNLNNFI